MSSDADVMRISRSMMRRRRQRQRKRVQYFDHFLLKFVKTIEKEIIPTIDHQFDDAVVKHEHTRTSKLPRIEMNQCYYLGESYWNWHHLIIMAIAIVSFNGYFLWSDRIRQIAVVDQVQQSHWSLRNVSSSIFKSIMICRRLGNFSLKSYRM